MLFKSADPRQFIRDPGDFWNIHVLVLAHEQPFCFLSVQCRFCTETMSELPTSLTVHNPIPVLSVFYGWHWKCPSQTINLIADGENMLGWLTVFALLTLCSLMTMLLGGAAIIPALTASAAFALLFFLCLLTLAVRSRT